METNDKSKGKPKQNKLDIYRSKMEEISFMAEHLNDLSEIFDVNSVKCKMFLIKSFTVLSGNFHYLSFLRSDAIDQELAKAANILQIYPLESSQKISGIFHNFNEIDVHKFWVRFLNQCKIHDRFMEFDSLDKKVNDMKFHSKFCNVNETLQYLNYDISILNPKMLKGTDIKREIKSWIDSSLVTSLNDSTTYDNPEEPFPDKTQNYPDTVKLNSDINYIRKKIDCESLKLTRPVYSYQDFFINFNNAVKQIITFNSNINIISSFIVKNLINNTTLNKESYWVLSNYKIKRCNDIIESIMKEEKKCALNIVGETFS